MNLNEERDYRKVSTLCGKMRPKLGAISLRRRYFTSGIEYRVFEGGSFTMKLQFPLHSEIFTSKS